MKKRLSESLSAFSSFLRACQARVSSSPSLKPPECQHRMTLRLMAVFHARLELDTRWLASRAGISRCPALSELISYLTFPRAALSAALCSMRFFVPEGKRLHSIIECIISSDKMTSTPTKIISSSINNLAVWYGERAPISYRLPLFGSPSHCRTTHTYR